MKTKIVVANLEIDSPSEIKHFEIRIPDNTKRISAIETSMRFNSAFQLPASIGLDKDFHSELAIGELRLQGAMTNTWFYAGKVKDNAKEENDDFYESVSEMKFPFVFCSKRNKEIINSVPSSTSIKGFYKDTVLQFLSTSINYTITIALHLETH